MKQLILPSNFGQRPEVPDSMFADVKNVCICITLCLALRVEYDKFPSIWRKKFSITETEIANIYFLKTIFWIGFTKKIGAKFQFSAETEMKIIFSKSFFTFMRNSNSSISCNNSFVNSQNSWPIIMNPSDFVTVQIFDSTW